MLIDGICGRAVSSLLFWTQASSSWRRLRKRQRLSTSLTSSIVREMTVGLRRSMMLAVKTILPQVANCLSG